MESSTISTQTLQQVLATAVDLSTDVVALTGVVLPSPNAGCFILQRYGNSRFPRAEFRQEDIVGPLVPFPQAEIDGQSLGATLHAVRIRKGARAHRLHERVYRVGTDPYPKRVLETYRGAVTGAKGSSTASLAEVLAGTGAPNYTTFPGAIVKGPTPDTFGILVAPWDSSSLVIANVSDIVDPNAIDALSAGSLPVAAAGATVYLLKIRNGAEIIAAWRTPSDVVHSPEEPRSGCGCGCGGHGERHEHHRDHALMGIGGESCEETVGPCPRWIDGYGFPCANSGTYCGWWFGDEHCKTVAGWIFDCVCSCQ